jgi:hypothetical protein
MGRFTIFVPSILVPGFTGYGEKKDIDFLYNIGKLTNMRTIRINAKCADLFTAQLTENGVTIGEYDGYVPAWLPNPSVEHYGDYVDMEIDIDTGKIVNWKKPTRANLDDFKGLDCRREEGLL